MRIRTVKPAFLKDEKLAEQPPLARLLFQGLWMMADGEGRMEYRPKYIKIECLPYDDADIPAMLDALAVAGFIQIYNTDGRDYIQVINFRKHQRITGKEAEEKSQFPAPPERRSTGKQRGNIRETSNVQEGKGKEGKGMDIAPTSGAAIIPEVLKPLTPIQLVVRGWKIQSGNDPEDAAWDKAHFAANASHAKRLLDLFHGDVDACLDCIEDRWNTVVVKQGLSLSLAGVVKGSDIFRQKWLEGKERRETGVR